MDRNLGTVDDADFLKVSPSSRRAWIEICCPSMRFLQRTRSPSSRRAWIEIDKLGTMTVFFPVALLAEGVDRNLLCQQLCEQGGKVALLAEGVDRNLTVAL